MEIKKYLNKKKAAKIEYHYDKNENKISFDYKSYLQDEDKKKRFYLTDSIGYYDKLNVNGTFYKAGSRIKFIKEIYKLIKSNFLLSLSEFPKYGDGNQIVYFDSEKNFSLIPTEIYIKRRNERYKFSIHFSDEKLIPLFRESIFDEYIEFLLKEYEFISNVIYESFCPDCEYGNYDRFNLCCKQCEDMELIYYNHIFKREGKFFAKLSNNVVIELNTSPTWENKKNHIRNIEMDTYSLLHQIYDDYISNLLLEILEMEEYLDS